ncbi:hypothetical protein HMPREF9134_00507 [Porphyromonas catoniae F0037]|uniref:Phage minor structural protein GP20 n=2 Tax=root TaxID=1 RepID=L1NFL3_9PORP|nr:hypothetical protein [Porphyromonas catoniae]EKY02121.1 hypothetical protein HMPREF9134_00507 [Porphyromonas catoniae F0037]DAE31333.1 MAG TPA: hypothetical protein [virus sp. ctDJ83]DAN55077.1 MAG TPA: hypothetical protein [Caudoviricetes sp.]
MKTKILQTLKQRYSNLGVSEKAFDGVADLLSKTITEESKIEEGVGYAEAFLKAYQSDLDKERGSASQLRKELEELKKPKKEETNTPTPPSDPNGEILKQVLETLQAQGKEIQALRGERSHEGKLSQINALLAEKKVPTSFSVMALSGRTFDEGTNIEELVSNIEEGYKKFQEEVANETFKGGAKPDSGGGGTGDELDAIITQTKEGTKSILNEK